MPDAVSKGKIIGWSIVAGIGLVLFGPCALRMAAEAPFRERLKELNETATPRTDATLPDGQMPYRTGKLLVLQSKNIGMSGDLVISRTDISPVWHRLPSSMRARKPDDVDTLINTWIGRYSHPPFEYVQLIARDMRRKHLIGSYSKHYDPDSEDPEKVLEELIRGMELRP